MRDIAKNEDDPDGGKLGTVCSIIVTDFDDAGKGAYTHLGKYTAPRIEVVLEDFVFRTFTPWEIDVVC